MKPNHIIIQISVIDVHLMRGVNCNLVPTHTHNDLLMPLPVCVPHHELRAAVINKANPKGVDIN